MGFLYMYGNEFRDPFMNYNADALKHMMKEGLQSEYFIQHIKNPLLELPAAFSFSLRVKIPPKLFSSEEQMVS